VATVRPNLRVDFQQESIRMATPGHTRGTIEKQAAKNHRNQIRKEVVPLKPNLEAIRKRLELPGHRVEHLASQSLVVGLEIPGRCQQFPPADQTQGYRVGIPSNAIWIVMNPIQQMLSPLGRREFGKTKIFVLMKVV
jgi:hypothetical protein